ncbi:MAG: NYN domain-containing protein [Dehalococcoidales bacterium]|nr:NYN domain-containing protein [Dehalococcoidales bacterium]
MDNREQFIDRQIAVLIDLENVGLGSIQWLFDQISDVGRIIVKRAYADWSVEKNKRDQLFELGIEPIQLFRSKSGGKNSSDIRLVIDAVDLLYTSPVNTFVIVSADSDFVPLVSKLRSAGKTVFGAGEKKKAPNTLIKACDRYLDLDLDKSISKTKGPSPAREREIENIIKRALMASINEHGRVLGSKLHQTILRLDPSFDYRSYGHSTFTKFLEASSSLRLIRPKGPGDVEIEPAEESLTAVHLPIKDLAEQVDREWSKRANQHDGFIPGPIAALQVAKILGVDKLSASQYKTLQGLLDASDYLSMKWSREGNKIIKKAS